MLKILLKKQLYELNSSFFYDRKKGKAREIDEHPVHRSVRAADDRRHRRHVRCDVFHAVQALCRSGT